MSPLQPKLCEFVTVLFYYVCIPYICTLCMKQTNIYIYIAPIEWNKFILYKNQFHKTLKQVFP